MRSESFWVIYRINVRSQTLFGSSVMVFGGASVASCPQTSTNGVPADLKSSACTRSLDID